MTNYKGDVNNKEALFKWLEKCENLKRKRKENKQKLLDEVVEQIMSDMYNYKQVIQECLYESFNKCPQHELKTWL